MTNVMVHKMSAVQSELGNYHAFRHADFRTPVYMVQYEEADGYQRMVQTIYQKVIPFPRLTFPITCLMESN